MLRPRRGFLLACCCLFASRAQGQPASGLVRDVRERLVQPEWLRGEFEQSKQVSGFKKPLLSQGDFVVARGRGVLWRTQRPFASELKLTRDQIRITQGGDTTLRLDAAREPAMRAINGVMFALLEGDVAALSEHFELQGSTQGRTWSLVLTPRVAALQALLQRIELDGDSYVRRITILEASGDRSVINLSKLRGDAVAEAGLFDR